MVTLKICSILVKHWVMLEEKLFEFHYDKRIFQLTFRYFKMEILKNLSRGILNLNLEPWYNTYV